ncbi:MAG: hypothetical protein RLZZ388_157 [Bacillota bacterium]|jgi:hypothetical protein
MPKPFIPPMKGNKGPFIPNQPKQVNRPPVTVPKPMNRRPGGRGG